VQAASSRYPPRDTTGRETPRTTMGKSYKSQMMTRKRFEKGLDLPERSSKRDEKPWERGDVLQRSSTDAGTRRSYPSEVRPTIIFSKWIAHPRLESRSQRNSAVPTPSFDFFSCSRSTRQRDHTAETGRRNRMKR
jgi:hypothetical protein